MHKWSDVDHWGASSSGTRVFWTCHHQFLNFFTFWNEKMFQAQLVFPLSQPCNHSFFHRAPWFLLVGNGRLPNLLFYDLSSLFPFFLKKQICVYFISFPTFSLKKNCTQNLLFHLIVYARNFSISVHTDLSLFACFF